jgi:hypothetical protein
MKLQCSCGAKYAFDLTPEMAQNPVKFVCPACGLDSSDYVNQLVREELAQSNLPDAPVPALAPEPPPAARLKISHAEKPAAPVPELPVSSKFCSRHRERATEQCAVCGKPICPKCLELLGYFCSPLCKGKAEAQNLNVPVFAGRKDLVEAKFWRKTGLIIGALVTAVVLALGAWTWYAWFGSVPHPVFSVRFDDTSRAYAGASQRVGQDQLVFLHGGTLARGDLKTKKEIWSQELISPQQIANLVKAESDAEVQMAQENAAGYFHRRSGADIETSVKQRLQARLSLHVAGENIWVGKGELLTHYDWDTGKVLREVVLPECGELLARGDELLAVAAQSVTHINLASGDLRTETIGAPAAASFATGPNSPGLGLPGTTADNGQPLDPQKVEAQAQNLNLPGRIALPALLGNASHEQQLEAALKDDPQYPRPKIRTTPPAGSANSRLVPGSDGFVEFSIQLIEEHLVSRSAMQAPPAKSVVNGDLNASQTTAAANEILNEMQRNRGGDTVTEDQSRYQVTVHLPGDASASDWTGEVVGLPQVFVLKTVNVVAAGKSVIVLDKANKRLWSAEFTYNVAAAGGIPGEPSKFGDGPCVEHGDTLYVFDQAVLSAFDLTTGNARWRLPSVGIIGLFFDGQNNLYVNTTTGNPDDIKYSRQIDIARKTEAVLFKLDPKTGKTLWSIKPGGYVAYLSGKFIYTVESYDPNPTDVEETSDMTAALQKPAYLSIKRIRPSDGRILWEHAEDRCPVAVRFDQNSLELIFKKEVQLLRFLTF